MSSATVSSSINAHHRKPSLSRYTSAPPLAPMLQSQVERQQDQEQQPLSPARDGSPQSSVCSSPDGSRSSSRRRDSFGSIKEDVDGKFSLIGRAEEVGKIC